ncbi:hypothetical protein EC991_003378 [Linnemannia zychae]|nr:hypothetical protein EC991_003378 [Linnemannia zychae]
MVGAKPVGPVRSTPTTAPITVVNSALLPSSSYSPQARIKYTIRAILQRPFPSITHVEASQEVWVLNSSLLPQFPLMSSLSPSTSVSRRSHSNASSKKRRRSAANKTKQATSSNTNSTPTNNIPAAAAAATENKTSTSPDSQEVVLKSQPLLSLPMPSQVFKSALAMLPTIDLSRSKQLFSLSKIGSTSTPEPASGSGPEAKTGAPVSLSQPSTSATTATAATSSASTTTKDTATTTAGATAASTVTADTDATTDAGSSSSDTSVHSPGSNDIDDNHREDNNDNIADYTGVWEAFDIPYSLSVPSEMVYLGQVVPLTIRFGPQRGYSSGNSNNTKQNTNGNHQDACVARNSPEAAGLRRFVVKKGVLRLMEHTLLREVTTAQVPHSKGSNGSRKNSSKALALTTNVHHGSSQATLEEIFEDASSSKDSSHRRAFSEHQPRPNNSSDNDGKTKPRTLVFGKRQDQNAIYQEQGYHGSHSHLPLPGGGGDSGVAQQQQRNTRTQHQHQLSLPGGDVHAHHQQHQGDLRRSFFKPNRHSMDVSASRPLSMVNPSGPTSGNSSSPRIVSSIEAKFKTEVMLLSLTPFLQRQEQSYQRQLIKLATSGVTEGPQDGSDVEQDQQTEKDGDDEDEEREGGGVRNSTYADEEDVEEDIEDGIWQTTIWVPIPGPSAMATFTETKNIVKTHTFQLILLCGLGEGANRELPVPAVAVPQGEGDADSGSVSTVSLSNVNKEFRIEMDLHVTSPRAPVEMSIRQM